MNRAFLSTLGALVLLANAATDILAQTELVEGQITRVDQSGGKLTIKHGPIRKFDMDGMTMLFRVQDPTMLKVVKAGDRIRFDTEKINGLYTVTRIEKVK